MQTPHIHERFLRHVWQHQRFNTARLSTADGRKVEIISPGVPNTDEGPDFKGARIRIGAITFYGDVELHHSPEEWESHLHQIDPHYNSVILHVVLTTRSLTPPSRTASKRFLPLLVLHPYLDETLRTTWMKAISDDRIERQRTIACATLNTVVPADLIRHWVERLAHDRIEMKVRRYEERLKELINEVNPIVREPYPRYYGNPDEIPNPTKEYSRRELAAIGNWEQLLYEAIMEGFGYAKNTLPFVTLAQSMRLSTLRSHDLQDTSTMMSLLFGAAGLLPSERSIPNAEARRYVRILKRRWNTLRPLFKGPLLHSADWLFFRLRPMNFPTARLASMAFLLPRIFAEGGFRKMIGTFKEDGPSTNQRMSACRSMFTFTPDEFWRRHYRFDQAPSARGISIGPGRVTDLMVNCLLPVVLLYARVFKDQSVRMHALQMLEALPSQQENAITRVLQRELFKSRMRFNSAMMQQGGIQLYKLYCSPVRCSECDIGRHVAARGE